MKGNFDYLQEGDYKLTLPMQTRSVPSPIQIVDDLLFPA
jgi:hypothetical protein